MKDRLLSLLPFYRWHPEVALRYLPIVAEIKKEGHASVLEVGSGGLGIAPYLKRKVVGLDRSFRLPIYPTLETKRGVATKLPFAARSFDVVICVDTLEHMPKGERQKSIEEIIRVAGKEAIIAVPFGREAVREDRELAQTYRERFGREFPFFGEHRRYGLPKRGETHKAIGSCLGRRKAVVLKMYNEGLRLRRFLMNGWMTKNFPRNIFFRKLLLLAIPIFPLLDKAPYYREIFYVRFRD